MTALPGVAAYAAPTKDNPRELIGWYFYDWANSAFSTTVVTVFLGPYLTTIATNAADARGLVYPLGIPVAAGAFFPYIVSLAVLLQVLVLPVMGAISDYSHRKKELLAIFAYLGALATIALFFLQGTNYLFGGVLFLVANLAFGASVVCYNAFLPDIASPERRDSVSARGWGLGYVGGGLLLALNLVLYTMRDRFGVSGADAARICLVSAGVWWAIFTIIPLIALRRREPIKSLPPGERYLTIGFKQLSQTLRRARAYPQTLLFLIAYLLYNDGIQTVITLSSQFGSQELGLDQSVLIAIILMVQFVGFFGTLVFDYVARWIGARRAIIVSLAIWTAAVIAAFFIERGSVLQFTALAAAIAIVLGGSQALSRSVFSLMIPKGQESEYFGLYEISDKGTSWLAPLLFGLALQFTGSYRIALVSLVVFFMVGIILLLRVDVRRAAIEAGNTPPERV